MIAEESENGDSSHGLAIAIIGMSGRFSGAKNIEEFWQNLRDGVESISFFSDEELVLSGIKRELIDNPNYVKAYGFLPNSDLFDASFFGYSPREADLLDPQQRIFLESAWEALENAGYDPETYKGLIGIYAGVGMSAYLLNNLSAKLDFSDFAALYQSIISNDKDYLPTRVSYKLNLKGPSVNVQTACSTSLVATHLACQSLLSGECDIALAGGVSVLVLQKTGYLYQEGMILSPDGYCRAFDAKAKGTIGGSGVGIVVLKRLTDAIADGDCIHAIIKGSAINNDGSLKVGYTAPSVEGQAAVISEAQDIAGIEAETITYIETHGTGTVLGDPIEIAALTQAFRASTHKKGFCAIGSVKTNVGHLDTAAGVTSLIKTVLALKHKLLPPSLHFEQPNTQIDFANSPFYVNTKLTEWERNDIPRRAGVSSFGIGGTNAHVILEEAPATARGDTGLEKQGKSPRLLVISAKTRSALETATANLAHHLKQHPELNLADVAYTLSIGRKALEQRRVIVCDNIEDAALALITLDPKRVFTNSLESKTRPVVFMFSGQGSQYVNMGRELYQVDATFRKQIDLCSEFLKPHLGLDLRNVLYPSFEQAEEAAKQLQQTAITQPALFVIEYSLAQLWVSWGIYPQATIGHSIGEYVAACLAGVFSLEDGLALVADRGKMMQQLPAGAMLAVPLPEQEVQPLLEGHSAGLPLQLAAVNSPSLCVVSGSTDAIEALQNQLDEKGVKCRRLLTSHAFHSKMMEPIVEPFTERVKKVNLKPPKTPFISNVTGTWITEDQATDPSYWARHLRRTVLFDSGLQQLLKQSDWLLLEVGPGWTLNTLAKQHPNKAVGQVVLSSLRHPQESQSDMVFLLNTLGKLWSAGLQADWSGFYAHERRYRIPLPTYPFERQRYWIEPQKQASAINTPVETLPTTSPLRKKTDIADWFYIPSWKRDLLPPRNVSDPLEQSCWLVFADECGLASPMVKRLKLERQEVITVRVGEEFSKSSDRVYTLNPRKTDDYNALIEELRTLNKTPKRIVHLWNVTPKNRTELKIDFLEKSQNLGFYSLLFLAQALGKQNITDSIHIGILTNNMHKVADEAVLCPEKATVLGPCKVIPAEYPNITCCNIDIVLPEAGTPQEEILVDQLWAEFMRKESDSIVAYRDSDRWVQTFEPIRLDKAVEATPRLREKGVYLITGGLGGIGLVLAEHLAKSMRAKLILISRSAFPERDEWEQWLATHDEQDRVSRKIRKVQTIEKLGAEILIVRADVANLEQMQVAITQALAHFDQIHGVIHAAGVPGGGAIQRKTREIADTVFVSKVRGTLVLDVLFKKIELDFFVLCSSLTSILGGFGQVDYCGANSFLDAFVHYKTEKDGTFTVCINWDAWQEVGMAAEATKQQSATFNARQTSKYKEINHPLFDECIVEDSEQEIYISRLSAVKHWVLNEHRAMGKPLFPGTAYLEMVRAAFENSVNNESIEFREVYFLKPLIVEDGEEKEVRTIMKKQGNTWEFSILSESRAEENKWQEHAKGKVALIDTVAPKRYEIRKIEENCNLEIIQTEELHNYLSGIVEFGPRWQALKCAKFGVAQCLAILELPEKFSSDLNQYKFHPSLMDVAIGLGQIKANGTYIPFAYERLRIKGSLPRKIYSYITYKEYDQSQEYTLKFNITIMDEQGTELVEIKDFTVRKVDFTALG